MCGFTGIIRFRNSLRPEDMQALSRMTDRLRHRGPDDGAQWSDEHAALGHRRLSILDLSPDGVQPMHSRDGRYVIVYNGEVYNFESLRVLLEAEGVSFKSSGDTQVILEAIAHWGVERTLPLLNGMFAIALWDKRENVLTLARDAAGVKPLFWSRIQDGLLFGSEIKALKSHPAFNNTLNGEALGDYFNRTYIAAPRTIYKDCYRLKPGQILRVNRQGEVSSASYVPKPDFKFFDPALHGEGLVDAFGAEMSRAVNAHMRADVPVAAFLSGGNDSALVAALAAGSRNFKTYSVGYHEEAYDESARASLIASHLSLSHETIMIGPQDVSTIIDRLPDFYDEPFADASALPTHILSRHVAQHAKVALSGDGADELFAGYPRYMSAITEWRRLSAIPLFVRPLMARLLPSSPDQIIYPLAALVFPGRTRAVPHIKAMLQDSSLLAYFQRLNYIGIDNTLLPEASMMDITTADIRKLPVGHDLLRALLDYDQAIRLPEGMLTKVDRASMAASLEVRVPFLDNNITALSKLLPSSMLATPEGHTKKIVKDLLLRYLPADIVNAPKTGFHVPMKLWLREHFSSWAQDLLSGDDPFIDLAGARSLWHRYAVEGDNDLFYSLWCVLMYRQWLRAQ